VSLTILNRRPGAENKCVGEEGVSSSIAQVGLLCSGDVQL
jgi:hypothetical protein